MNEVWRSLKVGDRIRIAHMPTEFSQADYFLHEDTRSLYEHLIAEQAVLIVVKTDEWDVPWIDYVWLNGGTEVHHSLAVNHGGLERVA